MSHGAQQAHAPMPLAVVGGWLGAGKTTLVNRLLREAGGEGRRIAVLVNDFGEVSIDADLIVGAEGGVLALAGGCVCCSFGADLVGAITQLAARTPPPQALLVETSGVGLPAAVARTAALAPAVRVARLVVLADATAVRAQAADRYVGDTVRQQLREADRVLLSKADLAGAAELAALGEWLRDEGLAERAVALPAPHERVAALHGWVFGPRIEYGIEHRIEHRRGPHAGHDVLRRQRGPALQPPQAAPAASRFVTTTRRYARSLDVAALGEALLAEGVLRAKGVLLDEAGQWLELQLAAGRVRLRARAGLAPRPAAAEADTDSGAGRLVTITLRRD